MQRQRVLERTGLVFWRCFASTFVRRRAAVLDDLLKTLKQRGIEPVGASGAPRSAYTEHREVLALAVPTEAAPLDPTHQDPAGNGSGEVAQVPELEVAPETDPVGSKLLSSEPPSQAVRTAHTSGDSVAPTSQLPPVAALPFRPAAFQQYVDAELWAFSTSGPLRNETDATLTRLIAEVVSIEGPVHFDTIMDRLRRRYGMGRAEESTRSHVLACIVRLAATGTAEMVRRDAGADLFLSQPAAVATPRSPGASGLRRPERIAISELMAGVRLVLAALGSSSREDLIVATAREFGFRHTSENMRLAVDAAVSALMRSQLIQEFYGHLRGID